MLQIRKFEEERKAWESQREELEERSRQLQKEKEEAEQERAKLCEEVERLSKTSRDQGSSSSTGLSPLSRSHYDQQLALMTTTIENLRNDVRREQERARDFEARASQAESVQRRLSADLDRLCLDRSRSDHRPSQGSSTSDVLAATAGALDELDVTRRGLERKNEEVHSLEADTLRLREELNNEKKKVVDLKEAATKRGAAWKEELEKINQELASKQRLEEEVKHLHLEQARYREELDRLTERESDARRQADRFRNEVLQARASRKEAHHQVAEKVEEMEILSTVVGGQLVAVEQELTKQVQQTSQLLELFLQHSLGPLTVLWRCCRRIAASGDAGNDVCNRQTPPIHGTDVNDLKDNLVKIVNVLRFAADVLEAHADRSGRRSVTSQPQEASRESTVAARIEEGKEYAKGWFQSVLA